MAELVDEMTTNATDPSSTSIKPKEDKRKKKKEKKRNREAVEKREASADYKPPNPPTSDRRDNKREKKRKGVTKADVYSNHDDDEAMEVGMAKESKNSETPTMGEKELRRQKRKKERLERRKEKEALLEKVPDVDEDGIAYTQLQIKRMIKRVKQGLAPVATEQEERERQWNEAQLRREEEAELAGMVSKRTEEEEEDDDDEQDASEPGPKNEDNRGDDGHKAETEAPIEGSHNEGKELPHFEGDLPPKKKSRRSKPVPSDYVCQACKNEHSPAHWIYDCPSKVTVRGTNSKKKKDRGFQEPDSRKVFVSGLPFDVKPSDVNDLFHNCGTVASCRLVKFRDTGRCNGQAYVTFETAKGATKAIELSGTKIDNAEDDVKKKKKHKDSTRNKREELKLKISRVLSRRFTKGKPRP